MSERYLNREHQRRIANMLHGAIVHLPEHEQLVIVARFGKALATNNEHEPTAFFDRFDKLSNPL